MNHSAEKPRPGLRARLTALSALLAFLALAGGCGDSDPVVIGFLGPLEGALSDVGVQGRNGAAMALEELSDSTGHRFFLMARDDRGNPDAVRAALREFRAAGAAAVIGPMTSDMAVAARDADPDVIFISPTAAAPSLSGRVDNFFRVIPSTDAWARQLGTWSRQHDGRGRAFQVADAGNRSYCLPFNSDFAERFTALGGVIAGSIELPCRSMALEDWEEVAKRIQGLAPDCLQVALSARDLARLIRAMHGQGNRLPVYSAPWAGTTEFLAAAGAEAENVVLTLPYRPEHDRPAFMEFRERFRRRFGHEPNFASALSYEAATLTATTLAQAGWSVVGLRRGLERAVEREGVISSYSLTPYGDVRRPSFLATVSNGTFRTLAEMED